MSKWLNYLIDLDANSEKSDNFSDSLKMSEMSGVPQGGSTESNPDKNSKSTYGLSENTGTSLQSLWGDFEERCAIAEHDQGQTSIDAQKIAFLSVMSQVLDTGTTRLE